MRPERRDASRPPPRGEGRRPRRRSGGGRSPHSLPICRAALAVDLPSGEVMRLAFAVSSVARCFAAIAASPRRRSSASPPTCASRATARCMSWRRSACAPRATEIRRGIFRDVSTTFEDADGNVHRVGFELLGVTRDGRPEPYFTERHGDYPPHLCRRRGRVPRPGSYTYVLTYETDRQVRWFDGKPELYWNVTGNDWAFPISRRERQPDAAGRRRAGALDRLYRQRSASAARTGAAPSAATACSTSRRRGGSSRRGADHRRGDSRRARSTPPSDARTRRYFLLDYREWIIGSVGLLVVFGYYLWAWNAVGRDPKGGTIIPLFHPPEGVSPALASYIRNWGFGANAWKAFTAAALSLAVRGLLVFDQEGKDLMLERTDAAADGRERCRPASRPCSTGSKAGRPRRDQQRQRQGGRQTIGEEFKKSVETESGGRYFQPQPRLFRRRRRALASLTVAGDRRLRRPAARRISACSSACCSSASSSASSSCRSSPRSSTAATRRSSSASLVVARLRARLRRLPSPATSRRPIERHGCGMLSRRLLDALARPRLPVRAGARLADAERPLLLSAARADAGGPAGDGPDRGLSACIWRRRNPAASTSPTRRRSPPSASRRCCPTRWRSTWRGHGPTPSPRRWPARIRATPIRCRHYHPRWRRGGSLVERQFRPLRSPPAVASASGALRELDAAQLVGLVGIFRRRRFGRRRRRPRRRGVVAAKRIAQRRRDAATGSSDSRLGRRSARDDRRSRLQSRGFDRTSPARCDARSASRAVLRGNSRAHAAAGGGGSAPAGDRRAGRGRADL